VLSGASVRGRVQEWGLLACSKFSCVGCIIIFFKFFSDLDLLIAAKYPLQMCSGVGLTL
jgi:hypothetical protein